MYKNSWHWLLKEHNCILHGKLISIHTYTGHFWLHKPATVLKIIIWVLFLLRVIICWATLPWSPATCWWRAWSRPWSSWTWWTRSSGRQSKSTQRCCYITVDSATTALQNGACTYRCFSKQRHYKPLFSHNSYMKSLEFYENYITLFRLEKNKFVYNIMLTQNHTLHITQSGWNN